LINPRTIGGYSLVELMIGLLLGSAVLIGLLQVFATASQAYKAQTGEYDLQQSGQFALHFLAREIRQAGYVDKPWMEDKLPAIDATSTDTGGAGDQLVSQYYSERNCFGTKNSPDESGEAPFYLKQTRFALRTTQRQLTWWCAYGPAGETPIVQANNQTLVEGVDSFQVLYGEDSDADGNPDRWVNAGNWESAGNIAVVTLALLIADKNSLTDVEPPDYTVLDHQTGTLESNERRELLQTTIALRNYRP